ncbi:glycosyl transferase group 1 [Methylocella silvestris BL2]|uniref:Glycosyl transferase group 1 n=1 Tax=Methylocella silvestris (strain DSM 15510 / CIP 108128 / LMG 27833 / NCIMB 13906 / BL2) TaxID=395965 RepID=B8EM22_METSB|nr:glycosyltransferase family 4 protein [Methylocella silvestris]ACK51411.1 glycosyl transferase group 1 [Methylocella silvestris BL2]
MNKLPWSWDEAAVKPVAQPDDLELLEPVTGSVFFAVCLPPPVHGQSLVNASVMRAAEEFAGADKVQVFDIGPGKHKSGLKYHLTRIGKVARAGLALSARGVRPGQQFYTVFESGFGIVYNFFIIALARFFGYNIILHHHTSQHTLVRQARFAALQRVAGGSCLNVVLSDEMAENLHFLYPKLRNILVSHNACHIAEADGAGRAVVRPNKLRIGFLSNLCREKGLDIVLDVATKCRERGLELTFVLAGPAAGEEANALLVDGRQRLGDYIEIIGPVRDKAKTNFFESIDVFLFPTRYRYEAQPLVLLEAMSYGLPAVTTNCGYIAELVGRQGAILEPDGNLVESIVDQLDRMVSNRHARFNSEEIKTQFRRLRKAASGELRDLMNALFGVAERPRRDFVV